MKQRPFTLGLLVVLAVLALAVAACAPAAPALPAAGTQPTGAATVPASGTSSGVTSTVVATGTVGASSSGTTQSGAGGALQSALDQTKGVTSYHLEASMSAGGTLGAMTTPEPGQQIQELELLTMEGDINGSDAHFTMSGFIAAFLGVPAGSSVELITVDGKAYVHGPVPLLGATEDAWYEVSADQADLTQPPLTPASFLDSFEQAGITPGDFTASGSETLNGQTCQVYAGDKDVVEKAFQTLGAATGATQTELENIDEAEFKFWVCADGYVHQVRMFVQGHSNDQPDQQGSFTVAMRLNNFGTPVTITAPENARPLQSPLLGPTSAPAGATPTR